MTKDKAFYILLLSSIGYSAFMVPTSFWALYSPFILKGEIRGTILEWVNFLSIMSFPAVALAGIFVSWLYYQENKIKASFICMAAPLVNLVIYGFTGLFL
ncbi:MAG: hypothetical protein M9931_12170 [Chitinophagales bacterium]|jgi:hypothetical protein|nr:hypothetical protein [Chitinophagales bacterium]MCO5281789.1 hypothetical protein [Chitinophagales bacterium]OJV30745.1 MAG: hypothetical protein BGO32_09610 [Bacteroidetes bacterium 37-13]HRN95631.1 hypothetical protein [Chitinophagales bacterium]HRP40244.1 hypothetical protein [Chitinophagales bacterium]